MSFAAAPFAIGDVFEFQGPYHPPGFENLVPWGTQVKIVGFSLDGLVHFQTSTGPDKIFAPSTIHGTTVEYDRARRLIRDGIWALPTRSTT